MLQSTSSFVLEQYQQLLKDHLVVTVFLTMLVGAGGNAGNQSAIKVIRGLVCSSMTVCLTHIASAVSVRYSTALLQSLLRACAGNWYNQVNVALSEKDPEAASLHSVATRKRTCWYEYMSCSLIIESMLALSTS